MAMVALQHGFQAPAAACVVRLMASVTVRAVSSASRGVARLSDVFMRLGPHPEVC